MSEQNSGAAIGGEGTCKTDGRDNLGRFTAGNPGGPGNPFARQMAAMRKAIAAAITAEDLEAITKAMIRKARDGDVAAAKLVYSYAAGRSAAAADPDTLDAHDLATRRQNTASSEDVQAVFHQMPAAELCVIAQAAGPHLHSGLREKLLDGLRQQDLRDQKRSEAAAAPPRPRAGRKADRPAAPAKPGAPAAKPDPSVADLLRSLPSRLLEPLSGPEVHPARLVPITDGKRDNPADPGLATAALTGRRRR